MDVEVEEDDHIPEFETKLGEAKVADLDILYTDYYEVMMEKLNITGPRYIDDDSREVVAQDLTLAYNPAV